MTSHPTLVAIVVTHNRLTALTRALSALVDAGCDGIVVVDMASADGTKDVLGLACRDGLRADLSRPHSAVLSAARTTGCPTRRSTRPSAIAARLTKATYKGSKTAG